jgi:Rod binding domain-containing protein
MIGQNTKQFREMQMHSIPQIPAPAQAVPGARTGQPTQDQTLMEAAQKLEATFLAEMLKAAGFGKSRGEFGGGAGEDQFGSMLVQEHAQALASTGGIGLAEHLFEALKERESDT